MKALLLACLLLTAAALPAPASQVERLDSPDVRQVWISAEPVEKKFYWDKEEGRFSLALFYAAAEGHPAQTVRFHFPHVRPLDGKGDFVLDLGNGRPVAVAHQFFFGSIHLADRHYLQIHRRHGVVRVTLEIEE